MLLSSGLQSCFVVGGKQFEGPLGLCDVSSSEDLRHWGLRCLVRCSEQGGLFLGSGGFLTKISSYVLGIPSNLQDNLLRVVVSSVRPYSIGGVGLGGPDCTFSANGSSGFDASSYFFRNCVLVGFRNRSALRGRDGLFLAMLLHLDDVV